MSNCTVDDLNFLCHCQNSFYIDLNFTQKNPAGDATGMVSQSHSIGYGSISDTLALVTVATPAQAIPPGKAGVSPCSSEAHSALALGRYSQLLPLSGPPLQRVLLLFLAFMHNAVSIS